MHANMIKTSKCCMHCCCEAHYNSIDTIPLKPIKAGNQHCAMHRLVTSTGFAPSAVGVARRPALGDGTFVGKFPHPAASFFPLLPAAAAAGAGAAAGAASASALRRPSACLATSERPQSASRRAEAASSTNSTCVMKLFALLSSASSASMSASGRAEEMLAFRQLCKALCDDVRRQLLTGGPPYFHGHRNRWHMLLYEVLLNTECIRFCMRGMTAHGQSNSMIGRPPPQIAQERR